MTPPQHPSAAAETEDAIAIAERGLAAWREAKAAWLAGEVMHAFGG